MTSNVICPLGSTAALSVAVEQFVEAKQAQRLSNNTLIDYKRTLRRFMKFFENEDPLITAITPADIRKFMNSLDTLSKKSVLNVHIGLSSLWHWATEEGLCSENIMHKISRPRPEIRAIQPFSHEEVDKLFNAICYSAQYTVPGKKICSNRLPYYYRMRAILLMLLDNGLREEELCHIRAKDLKPNYIRVFGKGDKERLVPISECTYDAILAYIQQERRGGAPQQEDFVFITKNWKPIKGDQLYHMVARVGVRAGVKA
jgi:integrase/recombinase XerD